MTDRWIASKPTLCSLLKSMSNKHTFNPIVSDFYKYTVEEFINEVHSVTMATTVFSLGFDGLSKISLPISHL